MLVMGQLTEKGAPCSVVRPLGGGNLQHGWMTPRRTTILPCECSAVTPSGAESPSNRLHEARSFPP